MANTFTRKLSRSVGTSATEIGSYTVPSATTTVVVGLSVTNRTGSAITANVFIQDSGVANTFVVVNAPISSGSSLVVGGGDQKLVLITGDKVFVQSSASASLDAVMSIMEIT
jgi:acetyltransferase-like isoleucine patch superfamily enzyme